MSENNSAIKLTARERRVILDRLYDRFVGLGDEYNSREATRTDKRQIRTERRALAKLINKLEGTRAIDLDLEI